MNCREIQDLLTSHLLDELTPAQNAAVREHLQSCPACQTEAQDLQGTLQLLRTGLADTAGLPTRLSDKHASHLQKEIRRHRLWITRVVFTKRSGTHLMRWAAAAAGIVLLAGLLMPNLSQVREKAQRVNDLSHLNTLFKEASAWGLNPSDSFRPAFPRSLEQLAKEGEISPEALVSPVSKQPIEYFPGAHYKDGGRPVLVSQLKGGRNIVNVGGNGMWIEDGTPEAAKLDQQLASLRQKAGSRGDISEKRSGEMPPPKGNEMAGRAQQEQLQQKLEEYASAAAGGDRGSAKPASSLEALAASEPRRRVGAGQTSPSATPGSAGADSESAIMDYAAAGPPASARKPPEKPETKEIKITASKSPVHDIAMPAPSTFTRTEIPPAPPAIKVAEIKVQSDMSRKIEQARVQRLVNVREFQKSWSVMGQEKSVRAKFTMFQAKYKGGDWDCNPGALSNLMFQIRAWSRDRMDANLQPEVMDMGTDQLFALRPPFVYLSGSRDFSLAEKEVKNLRDYLTLGGAIWVDSADTGRRSRFDNAMRRELKRVFPDRDLAVVPNCDHEMFDKFFQNIGLPPGWNNSQEPVEMLNIGNELAVLYTPNNYGKLWTYRLDANNRVDFTRSPPGILESMPKAEFDASRQINEPLVVNAYKFGINTIFYLLTRYQKSFVFLPKDLPPNHQRLSETNQPPAIPAPPPEPADTNTPPPAPVVRAGGVNPFVAVDAQPFSTFSIDVDTASYTFTRVHLLAGHLPPPESVRTEEFVNYFEYDYAPPNGATFAVHTDCGPSRFGRGLSLLKIGVKGRRLGREEKKKAVLTLLIDTSGSMATPDRMGLLQDALTQMVERLDPADKIAIVQYDSQPRLLLEHTPVSEKRKILDTIQTLQTSGSTALAAGMRLAYATAARGFDSAAANRVLLLSDGMANLGATSAEEILKSVADYRRQGISLSVFGFGSGSYNDAMLETLADKGDGVYAFIDSPAEGRRVMADELSAAINMIARDVKIQVEFNPQRVKKYRQLGYENRQLKKEQFRDDRVDAGEIGSGQSVTALYELELQGDPRAPLGMVRIRCRNALTGLIEEIEQPIMPPDSAASFAGMDARFRLAAAAAHFAEILRGSPFAAGSQFEDVARILRPVALELNLDQRIQELLRLTETGLTPKFEEANR